MKGKILFSIAILLLFLNYFSEGRVLSNVFGSNMVLQRAPVSASLYGWSDSGDTITVVFNQVKKYVAIADPVGAWNVSLDPISAGGPYSILAVSATNSSASVNLTNVMFGDVIFCSGQSNMQFTVNSAFNATATFKAAGNYTNIRVFTVGQSSTSSSPLNELATIEQEWNVANSDALGETAGAFSYFSAVCYFTAISIQAEFPDLPLGLISSNWGGTIIQAWSSPDAMNECPQSATDAVTHKMGQKPELFAPSVIFGGPDPNTPNVLWNAMIVPYLQMKVAAFLWYQAEANVGQTDLYRCLFPAMINDWRVKWGLGNVPFIFMQLAPYTTDGPLPYPWSLPDMRLAQTSGLALPNVAMISTIDLGDTGSPWTNIHPRDKITVGDRTGAAARALLYGLTKTYYEGPTLSSATIANNYPQVSIILNFLPTTIGEGLELRQASCPGAIAFNFCSTWEIGLSDGSWHIGAASIVNNVAVQVTLASNTTLVMSNDIITVTAVRYLYSDWPVVTLYSISNLPASPFYFTFVA